MERPHVHERTEQTLTSDQRHVIRQHWMALYGGITLHTDDVRPYICIERFNKYLFSQQID